MTAYAFVNDDTYEIVFTASGVDAIIRYRQGLNTRGEQVDYDQLSIQVQQAIYRKLKQTLEQHNYEQQHRHDSTESDE